MLDPGEFGPMLKIGMRKHNDTIKASWEAARFGAWLSMAPHTKKLPKTPEKLAPFAWEKTGPSRESMEVLRSFSRKELKEMILPKKKNGS